MDGHRGAFFAEVKTSYETCELCERMAAATTARNEISLSFDLPAIQAGKRNKPWKFQGLVEVEVRRVELLTS